MIKSYLAFIEKKVIMDSDGMIKCYFFLKSENMKAEVKCERRTFGSTEEQEGKLKLLKTFLCTK